MGQELSDWSSCGNQTTETPRLAVPQNMPECGPCQVEDASTQYGYDIDPVTHDRAEGTSVNGQKHITARVLHEMCDLVVFLRYFICFKSIIIMHCRSSSSL